MAKLDPILIPPAGLYVLTQDIVNPNGDRRCLQTFWRRPDWKRGQQFIVEEWQEAVGEGLYVLRPINRHGVLTFSTANEATIRLLLPHLKPIPLDTLDSVMAVANTGPERILRLLVQSGKLTLDDIKEAVRVRQDQSRPKD